MVRVAMEGRGRRCFGLEGGEDDRSAVVVVLVATTAKRPRAPDALVEPARAAACFWDPMSSSCV